MLKLIAFLSIISFSLCNGQTNAEYIFASANMTGFESISNNLVISSTSDIEIQGEISAKESITILPSNYYSILLKPERSNVRSLGKGSGDGGTPGTGDGSNDDGLEGTGLKIKTKGSGGGIPAFILVITPAVTTQYLTLSLSPSDGIFNRYRIYDVFGNLKKDQILSDTNSYTIDVSFLNTGNYIIVVTTSGNENLSKQFIKE